MKSVKKASESMSSMLARLDDTYMNEHEREMAKAYMRKTEAALELVWLEDFGDLLLDLLGASLQLGAELFHNLLELCPALLGFEFFNRLATAEALDRLLPHVSALALELLAKLAQLALLVVGQLQLLILDLRVPEDSEQTTTPRHARTAAPHKPSWTTATPSWGLGVGGHRGNRYRCGHQGQQVKTRESCHVELLLPATYIEPGTDILPHDPPPNGRD